MQKLKFTSLNILKLNNKIYLPYQLHQLPKWFNKYNTNFISIKGYTYILLEDHIDQNPYFNFKNFKEKLVFHKSYNYKQSR
jgi:hypothetical protein|tara:strand:- start:429 stop:671 length:243 start_codon:yes stop_codon:yes gene_type:complete